MKAPPHPAWQRLKVLSLFFIDTVANDWIYNDDGTASLGKIGRWFEEAYQELAAKPIYKEFAATTISTIHNGYFSQYNFSGCTKDCYPVQ